MARFLPSIAVVRSVVALLVALVTVLIAGQASAQCTQNVDRTPLRFSTDGTQVLVEVVERDDCFPDGIGSHAMEIRDTADLNVVERIELARGERDWSDPSTWEPRDSRAEIHRRRHGFLEQHSARFPVEVVRRSIHWASGALVLGDREWEAPAGLEALKSPYASELDVNVWLPRSSRLHVAVGTVLHAGRDRLVVLRS